MKPDSRKFSNKACWCNTRYEISKLTIILFLLFNLFILVSSILPDQAERLNIENCQGNPDHQ